MMKFLLSGSLFTNFSFFTMELWLSGSLSHKLFFYMMESRLSRSLFTNFSFTWWNFGYHGAFSRIFLSHDGMSAITEPFHEFFFHVMESKKCTMWGKTLFIYITEYFQRICLVKNLASWFRAPFARKRVRSSLF
jgi:hypothetical protein